LAFRRRPTRATALVVLVVMAASIPSERDATKQKTRLPERDGRLTLSWFHPDSAACWAMRRSFCPVSGASGSGYWRVRSPTSSREVFAGFRLSGAFSRWLRISGGYVRVLVPIIALVRLLAKV